MGSLMAGWDSPVLGDDKKVHARRNRSLTKEEVEAFWKQHRGDLITSPLASPAAEGPFGSLEKRQARPSPGAVGGGGGTTTTTTNNNNNKAGPQSPARGFLLGAGDCEDGADSPSRSRDWWTRSSWAFLNEPPQEEPSGRAQRYTPQFHVARIATAGNA